MTFKQRNRLILVRCFVILVLINSSIGDVVNSGLNSAQHEINTGDSEQQPLLLLIDDAAYDKRNNVNKFKNLMINKDNPERFDDDIQRDEQIYYIPRVASGKKRDVLALPGTRIRFGNSNFRHTSSFGYNRPAP